MKINYAGKVIDCRQVETYATRLRINDFLVGPGGVLLKVLTVQPGCPVWESNRRTKTAVLVETEDHTKIPLSEFSTSVKVLRPRKG